jgi:ParB-like chromosome segregation protein Spo0J
MNIVTKPLSELHAMEKNIRRHTEKQLKEYVRSLEMWGQLKPAVIDENGMVLAGNGLVEAMRLAGMETCECYVIPGLTDAQKKKVMLSDNRVYELGFTDTQVFDEIIRELGGDIDVPGWDADLLEMLNATVRDADEIIESYGTYEAEAVESVNSRERPAGPAPAAPAAAAPVQGAEPPAQMQRVIVCPNCGEQICL